MGKVLEIPTDRARAIRAAMRKVHGALDSKWMARRDGFGLLDQALFRLIGFAPPARLLGSSGNILAVKILERLSVAIEIDCHD
jgi:hypothetical protein